MKKTQKKQIDLPDSYNYLNNIKAPQILIHALSLYGICEFTGTENNPIILGWAEEVKGYLGIPYKHDSTPWCGLFMAVCAKRSGYTPPKTAIRAKEWNKFGTPSMIPKLGDILVFQRQGGGHVGLYVAEDDECFHVLGGNQGDKVSIVRIKKNRLLAARECAWKIAKPSNLKRIFIDNNSNISHSET